jgi:ComF family protein
MCDAVLSVVLAPSCAACGELLDHPTRGPVCDACWRSVRPLAPPLCECCGEPLPSWRVISVPLARCARCRRGRRFVDRALAAGAYDGTLRAIVHALKYEGRRSLAKPLAALMRDRCGALLRDADCLVPVPLHPSRRRARGFNQALDLAQRLSVDGLPVHQALRRARATPTQTGLPAARRHRNVRGAFRPSCRALAVRGSVVVLVDDVSTTGATLEACAEVLRDMGVREVRAVTAARAVMPPR